MASKIYLNIQNSKDSNLQPSQKSVFNAELLKTVISVDRSSLSLKRKAEQIEEGVYTHKKTRTAERVEESPQSDGSSGEGAFDCLMPSEESFSESPKSDGSSEGFSSAVESADSRAPRSSVAGKEFSGGELDSLMLPENNFEIPQRFPSKKTPPAPTRPGEQRAHQRTMQRNMASTVAVFGKSVRESDQYQYLGEGHFHQVFKRGDRVVKVFKEEHIGTYSASYIKSLIANQVKQYNLIKGKIPCVEILNPESAVEDGHLQLEFVPKAHAFKDETWPECREAWKADVAFKALAPRVQSTLNTIKGLFEFAVKENVTLDLKPDNLAWKGKELVLMDFMELDDHDDAAAFLRAHAKKEWGKNPRVNQFFLDAIESSISK